MKKSIFFQKKIDFFLMYFYLIMLINPLPDNLSETEAYARELFGKYLATVQSERQITPEELGDISTLVAHLHDVWRIQYTEGTIPLGIRAIHNYFARQFGLPRSATYLALLTQVLHTGYFSERNPEDLELKAFAELMGYRQKLRDEAQSRGELSQHQLDLSRLVNRDWRPPSNRDL